MIDVNKETECYLFFLVLMPTRDIKRHILTGYYSMCNMKGFVRCIDRVLPYESYAFPRGAWERDPSRSLLRSLNCLKAIEYTLMDRLIYRFF